MSMNIIPRRALRGLTTAALVSILLVVGQENGAWSRALAAADNTPTFTLSALAKSIHPDAQAFGLILEPIRHTTPNSQFFYRSPEGKAALKALGVKTIFYQIDRNAWNAPYDDFTAEPLTYPSVLSPLEAAEIAKEVGAEFVPLLNVTVLCKRANPLLPYSSANVDCEFVKAQDSVAFLKFLRSHGVTVKHVVLGLEPYEGCQWWFSGINCTMKKSAPGQHRIGLRAEDYVKRIIALPGDILTIRNTTVIVDGDTLNETYIAPSRQGNPFAYKQINNIIVPPNDYFVLGDNRAQSSDSRDWGFVPRNNIVGRAVLVYWPFGESNDGLVPNVSRVFANVHQDGVTPSASSGSNIVATNSLFFVLTPGVFFIGTWRRKRRGKSTRDVKNLP